MLKGSKYPRGFRIGTLDQINLSEYHLPSLILRNHLGGLRRCISLSSLVTTTKQVQRTKINCETRKEEVGTPRKVQVMPRKNLLIGVDDLGKMKEDFMDPHVNRPLIPCVRDTLGRGDGVKPYQRQHIKDKAVGNSLIHFRQKSF